MSVAIGVISVGTKLFMSKAPHTDLKVPPVELELVEMSYDASEFSIDRGSVTEHDRTAIGHTEKVTVSGLAEAGTATAAVFYEGAKGSAYRAILAAFKDKKHRYFKRQLVSGDTVEFIGSITSFSDGVTVDDLIAANISIKVSGGFEDTFDEDGGEPGK